MSDSREVKKIILLYKSQPDAQVTEFILLYKSQPDAQVTEFILSDNCSTCFGRHHYPSSGAQNNCNYSIW